MRGTPRPHRREPDAPPPVQARQDDGDEECRDEDQRERHQVLPPARAARGHHPANRDQGAGLDGEDAERKPEPTAPRRPDEEEPGGGHDQPQAELDQPVEVGKDVARARVTHSGYDGYSRQTRDPASPARRPSLHPG